MANIDPVILQLRADMANYQRDVRAATQTVEQQLGRQGQSVDKLERQITSSQDRIASTLRRTAGVIAAGFSVRQIVEIGDAWSDIQSQVGVAIRDMEAAPEMMEKIAVAARSSYSSLNATAEAFARNNRVLSEMGYNTDQALRFTEALNNALVATATRGDRARQVQDAIAKAMATGKLEAEGLESILTHGGAVAEVLARNLGVTTNQLYELRKEGKITGQVIAQSLIGNFEELKAQAEEMPATVGDAFQLIRNEITRYIGTADKGLGATEALATALIKLSDNIDTIAKALAVIGVVVGARIASGFATATAATIAQGAATARATAATTAYNTALAANAGLMGTTAARAAAASASVSRMSVAMTGAATATRAAGGAMLGMFGGPVGLAITGVTLAVGSFALEASRTRGVLDEMSSTVDKARKALQEAKGRGDDAAKAVKGVGDDADDAKVKVDAFAGAVGEAAQKLYDLAKARQTDALEALKAQRVQASLQYSDLYRRSQAGLSERIRTGRTGQRGVRGIFDSIGAEITQYGRRLGFGPDEEELQEGMREARDAMANLDDAISATRQGLEKFVTEADRAGNATVDAADKGATATKAAAKAAVDATDEARAAHEKYLASIERELEVIARMGEVRRELDRADMDRIYAHASGVGEDASRELDDVTRRQYWQQEQALRNLSGLYYDLFSGATDNIWDNFKRMGLMRIAELAAEQTFQALGNIFGGGNILGSLFGRASGGFVPARGVVRVNEGRSSGVELLRMGPKGGTVIPLGQANAAAHRGPTQVVQHITVDARNSVNPVGFEQRILSQANQFAVQAATASGQAAVAAAPGRMSSFSRDGT